jgi:hypothetical protein
MKKVIGLIFSAGLLTGLLLTTSCTDDPPPKRLLTFAESAITVNEADGIIEIEVILDKPALEDVTIDYELDGTAVDNEVNPNSADYVVVEDENDYGEIEIAKGETTGVIQIELFSDLELEDTETIEISLIGTDSEKVELTREDEIEVSIEQEDGLLIVLEWGETYMDVDMDLFWWAPTSGGNLGLTGIFSANDGTTPRFEFVFIPAVVDDGQYGISCNYYSGTANPMNFTVSYIPIVGGIEGTTVKKTGTYDLDNINPWFTSDIDPLLAATYTKAGNNYTGFSEILVNVNTVGSRTANTLSTLQLKKGTRSKGAYNRR